MTAPSVTSSSSGFSPPHSGSGVGVGSGVSVGSGVGVGSLVGFAGSALVSGAGVDGTGILSPAEALPYTVTEESPYSDSSRCAAMIQPSRPGNVSENQRLISEK